ncbi:MAG: hypothetical protein GX579_16035 [Chloroflexi bacterium]|jgi:hypothetical protein|nr:hypothetical protein [Chloroflexota bacterium]
MFPDPPPAPPAGRRCLARTKAGEPCRNWALPDSQAQFGLPLCAAHARRAAKAGHPKSAAIRLYGDYFAPADLVALSAFLDEASGQLSLAPEIDTARVLLRHLLAHISAQPPQDSAETARLTHLILDNLRTIARLVRDHHAITPPGPDPFMATLGIALDQLGEEWSVKL